MYSVRQKRDDPQQFSGQLEWVSKWRPDGEEKINIGGYEVGVLAKSSGNGYIIKTKGFSDTNEYSYVDLYLEKKDAFDGKNCFIRQYFPYGITEIPLQSIKNPIAEDIYGDWRPRSFISTISLNYGGEGKLTSLEQGKYRVTYSIERNKINMFIRLSPILTRVDIIVDGKNGIAKTMGGDPYINEIYPKNLLQEKIFDQLGRINSDKQFAAVLRGIENEDVTTYVCSHFGNQKLEELEENGVYLRFPHSGDGYWEDYFSKLDDENFRTLENGAILSKQYKFISDLGLHEKQDGFAVIPFKYNGHFVTLAADCSQKTIYLFDSSLYRAVGSGKKSKAFRDFLVGNYKANINLYLLNHSDLQGGKLEDDGGKEIKKIPKGAKKDCYEMGTCGFWTLTFCIEAAKCKNF